MSFVDATYFIAGKSSFFFRVRNEWRAAYVRPFFLLCHELSHELSHDHVIFGTSCHIWHFMSNLALGPVIRVESRNES